MLGVDRSALVLRGSSSDRRRTVRQVGGLAFVFLSSDSARLPTPGGPHSSPRPALPVDAATQLRLAPRALDPAGIPPNARAHLRTPPPCHRRSSGAARCSAARRNHIFNSATPRLGLSRPAGGGTSSQSRCAFPAKPASSRCPQSHPNGVHHLGSRREYAKRGPLASLDDRRPINQDLELPIGPTNQIDVRRQFAPQSRRHTGGMQCGYSIRAVVDLDPRHVASCC